MMSVFPGMDPYLEGHLWPDVHNSLAYLITVQLTPRLPETYTVQMNNYTVEDTFPEEDIGIMYPDVALIQKTTITEDPPSEYATLLTPETLVLPAIKPIPVKIPVVEIRDRHKNKLITAIELLSPVNKRAPGIQPYREKRLRLHLGGVHLIEIDLLRRGQRSFDHPLLPKTHYMISLLNVQDGKTKIWAIDIGDQLPVIPIPLLRPEEQTYLDIGKALSDLFEQRAFNKLIDYRETPPPPAFSEKEIDWMKSLGCMADKVID
ncbi:MAG TPA: DUF4058 family protein [Saprospiraceae bacterium]|nr:DUF4058 family protein [Saprospiraceae bacterium]HMQ82485.1 DUF4058 family protein [Saprospiraceae bacterium]